ncbi:MAG: flagellar hook-length control protein FliK [Candidatus Accumulibacter sp.]|jgi:hypothetical protein|nr:flagellar hook-length control protein FliK [Accumulibacter sp.]
MIPPDLASRLQANTEVTLRPVAPAQEITDKLSDFTAGQRLMAQVQALLPNGTYRAMINQRSITLALPFSARSGDALELEVTETNGKLALAVIAHREGGGKESVSATLSRTGQLISQLFSRGKGGENDGKALALNGNRPIAGTPPGNAQDILPLLKEAIMRSGMFYESHQAEWIEGRFAKAELLQEPQGKLSTPSPPGAEKDAANPAANPATNSAANPAANSALTARTVVFTDTQANQNTQPAAQKAAGEANPQTAGQIVAAQIQGVVHQQLDALANQTFVWQGQIWPGQDMRWEIEEDGQNRQEEDDDDAANWRTRLDLSFPVLGGISARLQLHGNQVSLSLDVDSEVSLGIMRSDAETLRQRLEDAGLTLASLGIALPERGAP